MLSSSYIDRFESMDYVSCLSSGEVVRFLDILSVDGCPPGGASPPLLPPQPGRFHYGERWVESVDGGRAAEESNPGEHNGIHEQTVLLHGNLWCTLRSSG